jgi:hypothetical protein
MSKRDEWRGTSRHGKRDFPARFSKPKYRYQDIQEVQYVNQDSILVDLCNRRTTKAEHVLRTREMGLKAHFLWDCAPNPAEATTKTKPF